MPLSHDPVRAQGKGMVVLSGRFAPNSASAPTYPTTVHPGWSVVWTSTGLFTLTFADRKYPNLVSFNATLQLAAADDKLIQLGTYTAPTSSAFGTMTIRVYDISAAGVADITANANNQIHFVAVFSEHEKFI